MKRIVALLLAALLALSLAACDRRQAQPPNSSSDAGEGGVQAPSEPQPQPESSQESDAVPRLTDAFIRDVLINFGAEEVSDDQRNMVLRPRVVSLFYSDSFTEEALTPWECFNWYFSYSLREELTDEERTEKYRNPLGDDMGWFFPAEYFEPVVMTYFDVTTETLRSDPYFYDAEHNGYTVGGGGGKGEQPVITLQGYEADGELVDIRLNFPETGREHPDMVLTIRLTGDGYQYVSYLPQT